MTISNVAIVGAGRMGQGIAAALAFGHVAVSVVDLRDRGDGTGSYLQAVEASIRSMLERKVILGLLHPTDLDEVLDRVTVVSAPDALTAMSSAQLVFEAVPEIMEVKRVALSWIENTVEDDVPIASTTSSFLVTDLYEFVSHPERFLNAHWLNPADLIPLVEISAGVHTSELAVEATRELLIAIGKTPVTCSPSPGYIVPRLQALVMNEAARMVAEGVASAEDIDRAVRIGFGARFSVLGLLEFIDWGGCDILYHASNYLRGELGERFSPAELVESNMASGRRGISDGQGFYTFDPLTVDEYQARRTAEFARILDALGELPRYGDLVPAT